VVPGLGWWYELKQEQSALICNLKEPWQILKNFFAIEREVQRKRKNFQSKI
jgi:hypothetical protein